MPAISGSDPLSHPPAVAALSNCTHGGDIGKLKGERGNIEVKELLKSKKLFGIELLYICCSLCV
jgi:hypothetical protein